MSEKVMITGAKHWAERCNEHAGEEVQNGIVYVWFLLQQLAQLEAENEALREFYKAVRNEIPDIEYTEAVSKALNRIKKRDAGGG